MANSNISFEIKIHFSSNVNIDDRQSFQLIEKYEALAFQLSCFNTKSIMGISLIITHSQFLHQFPAASSGCDSI